LFIPENKPRDKPSVVICISTENSWKMEKRPREEMGKIPWLSMAPLQLEKFFAQGFLQAREILSPKAVAFVEQTI